MEESFQGYQSLSHSKWDCKYHVVFIPKERRKAPFGQARRHNPAIKVVYMQHLFEQQPV
jgi:REP element-mobilizing transposase RayT